MIAPPTYNKYCLLLFVLLSQTALAQQIEISPRPANSESPTLSPQIWARIGAGVTQARYSQSVPQFTDIAMSDDLGPSLHFDAGRWWSWHWGANAYFKNTPGVFKSSLATEVQQGNFSFRRAGIEMLYRTHPVFEEQRKETFLKLGIHQHELPFLIPVTNVTLRQQSNRVNTVGVGAEHHRNLSQHFRLEGFLRYQYPFTSGVTPHFTMDGAFGLVHHLPHNWLVALFWTGEWHDYKYETGSQNLFQSTFDLRAGVEF